MKHLLREFTPEFVSAGRYKISVEKVLNASEMTVLDIRTVEEEECMFIAEDLATHYPNLTYHHIPMEALPDRLDELPKQQPIAVLCRTTSRSPIVYAFLRMHGFDQVKIVEGGYVALVKFLTEKHGI